VARASLILVVLALAASRASAETRSILIRVTVNGDKTEVTVHSEEKKDRREKVTAAEAAKAIAAAQGWGSVVNVYVAADEGVKGADLKKVLDAAKGNVWCKLHPVNDVPQRISEVFASHDADPEPPAKDQAKRLQQIAKTMDTLAKRLKDGSVDKETQKLQEKVLSQLGEALKREKAAKREKERLLVAPGIENVRAVQERIAKDVKRLAELRGGKEMAARLGALSAEQAKAAQMLRDAAAHCKPSR
jgi:hypothetical protein